MGDTGHWSPWRHLREHHPSIRVFETELSGDMLGCLDHYQQIIWVDSRLTCAERRATVGHECGHLELDVCVNDVWVSAPEWKVDRWAARRLVDIEALARAMTWTQVISEMAEELFVDEKTVRDRLRCATDEEQDLLMRIVVKLRAA